MKTKEKEILGKIIAKNLSINEQKSALIFFTILFVFGWVSGFVDYSNFYSDIPALIQLGIFLCIIAIPFITLFSAFKIARNNIEINFISTFIVLSSFIIKRLLINFSIIIFLYVVSYTLLKEFLDIVFYEVQYYFSNIIILLIEFAYFRKLIKYFKFIYENNHE